MPVARVRRHYATRALKFFPASIQWPEGTTIVDRKHVAFLVGATRSWPLDLVGSTMRLNGVPFARFGTTVLEKIVGQLRTVDPVPLATVARRPRQLGLQHHYDVMPDTRASRQQMASMRVFLNNNQGISLVHFARHSHAAFGVSIAAAQHWFVSDQTPSNAPGAAVEAIAERLGNALQRFAETASTPSPADSPRHVRTLSPGSPDWTGAITLD